MWEATNSIRVEIQYKGGVTVWHIKEVTCPSLSAAGGVTKSSGERVVRSVAITEPSAVARDAGSSEHYIDSVFSVE
jgi:hypothetical protein